MNTPFTLPKEWKQTTLGDITKNSLFGPRFPSSLYALDGCVGSIRTSDIDHHKGEINYNTIPFANLTDESFQHHYLNDGDLLITRSGTYGIPCVFKKQKKPIIAGAFLIKFSLKKSADPYYIYNILKLPDVQKKIQRMASGGVQKNITGTNLKKLNLILPPIKEQRKIVSFLTTWDKELALTERLLNSNKKQKKALMQQLLTGKKRFSGYHQSWQYNNLKHLCLIKTGKKNSNISTENGVYPFFTCAKKPALSNEYSFNCEAILIAGNGSLGKTHYYKGKFEVYQRTYVLYNFSSLIHPPYLYQFILFWLKKEIERGKQHSAMPYIKINLLQNFEIAIPSLKEQIKIATLLNMIDHETELLKQKLKHIKQERKTMTQLLLTGQKRLGL